MIPQGLLAPAPAGGLVHKNVKFPNGDQTERRRRCAGQLGIGGRLSASRGNQPRTVRRPFPPRRIRSGDACGRLAWLGVVPFLAFAFASCCYPAGVVIVGAFQNDQGPWTIADIRKI